MSKSFRQKEKEKYIFQTPPGVCAMTEANLLNLFCNMFSIAEICAELSSSHLDIRCAGGRVGRGRWGEGRKGWGGGED